MLLLQGYESLVKDFRKALYVKEKFPPGRLFEHGQRHRNAHLGPAEGGDVDEGILVEESLQFFPETGGAHGVYPPGQAFADDDDIGHHAIMLYAPEPSGAAKAGLDLVHDEERAVFRAQILYQGVVVRLRDGHAQGSRNGLEDDGCRFVVNGGPDGGLVIEGHLDESLGLRPEG